MTEKDRPKGNSKLLGLSALSVSSMGAALLSYLRFAQITAIFGANWRTDALAVAMVFPFLLRDIVNNSFGAVFIPIYSRVVEKKGHKEAVLFVNKTISWLVLSSSFLILVLWLSSDTLVKTISPNGSDELLDLASNLLRILLPMVILSTVNGILGNFLKYEKRFTIFAFSGLLGLAVSLTTLLLVGDGIGIKILPVSMLLGGSAEFVFLLVQSFRSGFEIHPSISPDPFMGQMATMAAPVVGGTLVGFLAPIADKMLASFLPESSVTAIDYANRIKNIVLAVVFNPLLIFADLSFSAEAAKGRVDSLLSLLRRNLNTTSLVMLPTAGLLTVLAVPVVSVFFQRGNFTGGDSEYVGYALAFYAPWLAQFGAGSLVSRAFYARKNSATPVTIGVFAMVANVLLNIILVGPLGIGGLALATTLTSTVKTGYLTWSLSREVGGLHLKLILPEQVKIIAANTVLVAGSLTMMHLWPFSTGDPLVERFLHLVVSALSGVLPMAASLYLLKSSTLTGVLEQIREKTGGSSGIR